MLHFVQHDKRQRHKKIGDDGPDLYGIPPLRTERARVGHPALYNADDLVLFFSTKTFSKAAAAKVCLDVAALWAVQN
ncbi:MAG TPA: hypothetical protein VFI95_15895, partial [Terriglobales bacterium]|nr:hypothetical protein [Terriglobales bacterium]